MHVIDSTKTEPAPGRVSALSIISLAALVADLAAGILAIKVVGLRPTAASTIEVPVTSAFEASMASLAGHGLIVWGMAAVLAALVAKELWRRKAITLAINVIALAFFLFAVIYWGGMAMRPF